MQFFLEIDNESKFVIISTLVVFTVMLMIVIVVAESYGSIALRERLVISLPFFLWKNTKIIHSLNFFPAFLCKTSLSDHTVYLACIILNICNTNLRTTSFLPHLYAALDTSLHCTALPVSPPLLLVHTAEHDSSHMA